MNEAEKIVSEMTAEEKAGLTSGADFWHSRAVARLGVPAITMSDGPHGLRKQMETKGDHMGLNEAVEAVCFPAACATACSFDRELLAEMGDLLGKECRAEEVNVLLGPAVNIKRSPLCGRNFEYFSEDPYLAGELAAAYIRGVQQNGVGVSLKHFAANNQEYERMYGSSDVDLRTLREIYLTAFEIAVKKAEPWTVMCSYNRINGVFAAENAWLLTEVLRKEWGFDGVVVSDWGAVRDRLAGLCAGLELEMPGSNGTNDKKLVEALKNGTLPEETLNQAAIRLVSLALKGIEKDQRPEFHRQADHEKAIRIAEESMVLLKNEKNVLPLQKTDKVLFVGGFAEHPRYQGGGSSHINAHLVEKATDLFPAYADSYAYAEGFSAEDDVCDVKKTEEALEKAAMAEKIVVFAGLPDRFESESFDRTHMALPACQLALIDALCGLGKPVIVVLENGSPVELPFADKTDAILEAYLGGEGTSAAILSLLYGKANPSGKLAESFPMQLSDNPSYLNFPGSRFHVPYAEGVFVGYRYYDAKKMAVRYPFGHGLSYTTFAYSDLKLSSTALKAEETLTVSFTVTNTGTRFGKEIAQVYVSDQTGTETRPIAELKGFAKIALAPGEQKEVTVSLPPRAFSYYSTETNDWYAPNGQYEIRVGCSSRDTRLTAEVTLSGSPALPMPNTGDAMIGDLLHDPRTASFVQEKLMPYVLRFTGGGADGGFDEMVEAMVRFMPLRSLRSFAGMTNEELDTLVRELQKYI